MYQKEMPMRSVRLTLGHGYALVMASVISNACGGESEHGNVETQTGGTTSKGGHSTQGGNRSTSTTIAVGGTTHIGTTSVGGTGEVSSTLCSRAPSSYEWSDCTNARGGAPIDYPFPTITTVGSDFCDVQFIVPVAPEGTPPSASEICAQNESAVSAGWAARVTLTESANGDGTATGRIALASDISMSSVTQVTLSIVDYDSGLGQIEIGTITRQNDVFVFPLTFISPTGNTPRFPRLVLVAKLTLDCNGQSKTVVSTTALYRCDVPMNANAWVSSGDACGECAVICEMAASPIVPPISHANEPLQEAVRTQVSRVGQYGSMLLLQAVHDGGANRFTYEWDVSSGKILWQEDDLILWAPPQSSGEHLVQVSLLSENAAAVASTRLRTFSMEGA
jgi:hypothetical protein